MNTHLEDRLPFISTRIKGLIAQIYENLMAILHEEQNHQREQWTQLFDDLLVIENNSHDTKIDVLCSQKKLNILKSSTKNF